MAPELRFDDDGFIDLSVFPDIEPDVHGYSAEQLDPKLGEDRRGLDATFDRAWLAAALDELPDSGSVDDHLLLALLPAPHAAEHPATRDRATGDGPDEGHDIDVEISPFPTFDASGRPDGSPR